MKTGNITVTYFSFEHTGEDKGLRSSFSLMAIAVTLVKNIMSNITTARNISKTRYNFLFEITFTRQQQQFSISSDFKDHIVWILFLRIQVYMNRHQNKLI